jgi:protein gp37
VRGCTKISPGCKHCYAETFAERFRGVTGHPFEHGFDLRLVPEKLAEPLRWRAAKTIFVNSMSDLLHERVSDEYIEAVCSVMEMATWHTFQVLTKRADRMSSLLGGRLRRFAALRHIWWGGALRTASTVVLLQAMGRGVQGKGWPRARRPDLG